MFEGSVKEIAKKHGLNILFRIALAFKNGLIACTHENRHVQLFFLFQRRNVDNILALQSSLSFIICTDNYFFQDEVRLR
jgi:hypothetical protein